MNSEQKLLLRNVKYGLEMANRVLIEEADGSKYFIEIPNDKEAFYLKENVSELHFLRVARFNFTEFALDELIVKNGVSVSQNIVSPKHHKENPFTVIHKSSPFLIMSFRQRCLNILEGGKIIRSFIGSETTKERYFKAVTEFIHSAYLGEVNKEQIKAQ